MSNFPHIPGFHAKNTWYTIVLESVILLGTRTYESTHFVTIAKTKEKVVEKFRKGYSGRSITTLTRCKFFFCFNFDICGFDIEPGYSNRYHSYHFPLNKAPVVCMPVPMPVVFPIFRSSEYLLIFFCQ